MNGPKGISCVFFVFSKTRDTGKAIKAEKNIATIDNGKPKTKPITPNNLISPPPIDSFLNKKSPNNFNINININEITPFSKDTPTEFISDINKLIIINDAENTNKILSGIIIV